MKLAETDKKIMELLHANKFGLGNYEIARLLKVDPAHVFRRLKKIQKHGLLETINSKPVIYRINLKKKYELTFFDVECPKCGACYRVHFKQETKRCTNPDCKTPSGEQTRFYLTEQRIIHSYRVI